MRKRFGPETLLDGGLLLEDDALAVWENAQLTIRDSSRLPLLLVYHQDLPFWLANRAIDTRRTNSRMLRKVLRMKTTNPMTIALFVHGAAITDRFWFKGENLCWKGKTSCIAFLVMPVEVQRTT